MYPNSNRTSRNNLCLANLQPHHNQPSPCRMSPNAFRGLRRVSNIFHSTDALLLDSTFRITAVNDVKYDRVARIFGERDDLKFSLDINSEIYPVFVDETVQLSIASTLNLDGSIVSKESAAAKGGWRDVGAAGEVTLADQYDYVVYGKMYRFEEGSGETM